jgi:ABC-type polysaccharide/polyol phosphate export permease
MIKYIIQNAISEYKNSYKQSLFSYLWVILHPILLLIIYTFVFSQIMQARVDINENISYSIYLSVAILPWIIFSTAITSSTLSITNNIHIIKKTNTPLYTYVLIDILKSLFNILIVILLLFIFLYLSNITFTYKWILVFIPTFLLLIFALGLGMFLSSINVFFKDIQKILNIFLQILMWALPIVYPWTIIPFDLQWIIFNNPLFYYFNSIREVLLFANIISYKYLLIMFTTSSFMLFIGIFTLSKLESDIRDSI